MRIIKFYQFQHSQYHLSNNADEMHCLAIDMLYRAVVQTVS
jgi:hypothetical protein